MVKWLNKSSCRQILGFQGSNRKEKNSFDFTISPWRAYLNPCYPTRSTLASTWVVVKGINWKHGNIPRRNRISITTSTPKQGIHSCFPTMLSNSLMTWINWHICKVKTNLWGSRHLYSYKKQSLCHGLYGSTPRVEM